MVKTLTLIRLAGNDPETSILNEQISTQPAGALFSHDRPVKPAGHKHIPGSEQKPPFWQTSLQTAEKRAKMRQ